jgi:hypothetical protein
LLESFTLENIFLVMFLVGFLFTLLSAIMSGAFGHAFGEGSAFDSHGAHVGSMGGDVGPTAGEGAPEVGWAQHNLATFSPLSPTTISAFLTAAGGVGWLCVARYETSAPVAILAAMFFGLAFAAIAFLLIAWMFKVTQSSSLVNVADLVGHDAEVSIRIESGGTGEVAFVSAGQRCVMQARSVDASVLPTGTKVVIKSVTPTVYFVEETRESWLARTKGENAKAAY